MGLAILLATWLGWNVYNGEIYPREAGIAVGLTGLGCLILFLFHAIPGLYVIPLVGFTIYMVVKTFGGDVQIH